MIPLTTGVDLIEVSRIEQAVRRQGQRFIDRIFTASEQAYCAGDPRRLAGRFAVKEAVSKALGTGIGDMNWTDIEILCDERGKPTLVLHAEALALAQAQSLGTWAISLAHTETHAIGLAVASQA